MVQRIIFVPVVLTVQCNPSQPALLLWLFRAYGLSVVIAPSSRYQKSHTKLRAGSNNHPPNSRHFTLCPHLSYSLPFSPTLRTCSFKINISYSAFLGQSALGRQRRARAVRMLRWEEATVLTEGSGFTSLRMLRLGQYLKEVHSMGQTSPCHTCYPISGVIWELKIP